MQESVSKLLKRDLVKNYGFPVTYTDEEQQTHSYNVFTDTQFRQIVKQMFGSRIYNDWDDVSEISDLLTDFQASFDQWKATRADTYGRRMYALSIKYNPLENYNGHEEVVRELTHGEKIELTFDGRKEQTTDDSYIERTHTNFKTTTTDDTYVQRQYDDFVETTKDDTYVEQTYDNYKETTKDDTYVEHSWGNNYEETYGHGQQTVTHNVSADDSSAFAPRSQDITGTYDDTKSVTGTTKDQNGYNTIGVERSITGKQKSANGYTNGRQVEQSGSYTDRHGQEQDGVVVETSGSYKDAHGYTDGIIREQLGSEATEHSGKDKEETTTDRAGNLGVTTSQQMLESDINLLKYDIAMIAIKEFISGYTYFDMEVDYGY